MVSLSLLLSVKVGKIGDRFIEHMKILDEDGEEVWGLNQSLMEEKGIEIVIDILEDDPLEVADRLRKEAEMILQLEPILQTPVKPNHNSLLRNVR